MVECYLLFGKVRARGAERLCTVGSRMRNWDVLRVLLGVVMLFGLLPPLTSSVLADNAPMQPTTAGLVPGLPGTTVRMASERVDIAVTERDGAVHAIVNASFDMFNHGPTVTLTTGFPKYSGGGYMVAGGFAGFDPTQFADFRASSGTTEFQPTIQPVTPRSTADQLTTADWYVWQMDYPGNQLTNVRVSYDQTLSVRTNGFTYVSYILRTGALWDGTIGEATVTMSTSGGGAFLVPSTGEARQAFGSDSQSTANPAEALPTSSSPTQLVWQLSEIEPTFDPYAYYIPSDAWQRLSNTQARLALDAPSGSDYASAVEALLDAVGRDSDGLPWLIRHRPPQALKDRFEQGNAWADQATQLDQTNPAAFEALGDIQYAREVPGGLYIECRPQLAPVSFQTAVDLGSPTAQARLDGISLLVRKPFGHAHACSIDPNQPVADPVPDTLTDAVRTEIRDAIDRANSAWSDSTANLSPTRLNGQVAGSALSDDLTEIQQLLQAHQRRRNANSAFDVLDVSLDAPGHAIVHTRETWSAEILDMASYKVVGQIPPAAYNNTYTLEFVDGGWIVTGNQTSSI
jgi:hypothetical protein